MSKIATKLLMTSAISAAAIAMTACTSMPKVDDSSPEAMSQQIHDQSRMATSVYSAHEVQVTKLKIAREQAKQQIALINAQAEADQAALDLDMAKKNAAGAPAPVSSSGAAAPVKSSTVTHYSKTHTSTETKVPSLEELQAKERAALNVPAYAPTRVRTGTFTKTEATISGTTTNMPPVGGSTPTPDSSAVNSAEYKFAQAQINLRKQQALAGILVPHDILAETTPTATCLKVQGVVRNGTCVLRNGAVVRVASDLEDANIVSEMIVEAAQAYEGYQRGNMERDIGKSSETLANKWQPDQTVDTTTIQNGSSSSTGPVTTSATGGSATGGAGGAGGVASSTATGGTANAAGAGGAVNTGSGTASGGCNTTSNSSTGGQTTNSPNGSSGGTASGNGSNSPTSAGGCANGQQNVGGPYSQTNPSQTAAPVAAPAVPVSLNTPGISLKLDEVYALNVPTRGRFVATFPKYNAA